MSQQTAPTVNIREILAILKKHHRLWGITALLITGAAIGYAVFKSPKWKATQSVIVRDEAGSHTDRQGQFESPDDMKTAQETILEVARNQSVAQAALLEAGPEGGGEPAEGWPSGSQARKLARKISVSAPRGAEFGHTEMIFISVIAKSPERATVLNKAVCNQLEKRLQEIRRQRAESVINELTYSVEVAQNDVDSAIAELQKIETSVGTDLIELRSLADRGSGDSNLRNELNRLKEDLRAAETRQVTMNEQQRLLTAARGNPDLLLAASGQLLESQPALRRLKDGLVDAQLRTAELLGRMSADHPNVQAAQAAEQGVRDEIHRELDSAVRTLAADKEVVAAQTADLNSRLHSVQTRLDRLAGLRARYTSLVDSHAHKQRVLEQATENLAEARAAESRASVASLLTRMDEPVVGSRPEGARTSTIILTGIFGGLATGFGLVFLTVPLSKLRGRRFTDLFHGRRASDRGETDDRRGSRRPGKQSQGRRASDYVQEQRGPEGQQAAAVTGNGQQQGRRASDVPATAAGMPAGGDQRRRASDGEDRRAAPPIPPVEMPIADSQFPTPAGSQ